MGFRSILYRLNAKLDVTPLAEDQLRATACDRSNYGPQRSHLAA
jgi:hypothetical protein